MKHGLWLTLAIVGRTLFNADVEAQAQQLDREAGGSRTFDAPMEFTMRADPGVSGTLGGPAGSVTMSSSGRVTAGAMGAEASAGQVWSYLANYVPGATPAAHPELARLVETALAYNRDFVAPTLVKRAPEPNEAVRLAAVIALSRRAEAANQFAAVDLGAVGQNKDPAQFTRVLADEP